MRRKMLNFYAVTAVLFLTMLLSFPIGAMAEADGAWTTTASPGYTFLTEEDIFNNEKHMSMTVLKPGYIGGETYWGKASASNTSTYLLRSLTDEKSDMTLTWKLNNPSQATVTVDSCTGDCLWQPGQVVTLSKFFGDMRAAGVPKTGRTKSFADYATKKEFPGRIRASPTTATRR